MVTDFVCLAMDTVTGRQLGRFLRFVRVDPPPPQSPTPEVFLDGIADAAANGAGGGGGGGPGDYEGEVNPMSTALPLPLVLDELQKWMASIGLHPGQRDESGFSEHGNFRRVLLIFGYVYFLFSPAYVSMREMTRGAV